MRGLQFARPIGLAAVLTLLFPFSAAASPPYHSSSAALRPGVDSSTQTRVDQAYGRLPLTFEANEGQTGDQVKFLARGRGYTLFLNSTEAVLLLSKPEPRAEDRRPSIGAKPALPRNRDKGADAPGATAIRMQLIGANPDPDVVGREPLPGKVNYFVGKDPTKWRTNVATYARVEYTNVYRGIDLIYHGNERQVEYDFVIGPGADPAQILLNFEGADKLEVDAQGDLVVHMAAAEIRTRKPFVYQDLAGVRNEISGGYVIEGSHRVSFRVAAYDASRPLVIDPVLSYSTYLGGSNDENEGRGGIAVDIAGNAYLVGVTASMDFPTTLGAFQTAKTSIGPIVYVTKLNPTGSGLVYSTYLGGSNGDLGHGIAVDGSGNAYVAGAAFSTDFPTTPGAYQTAFTGESATFVTKLNPTGSGLVYSTFIGGSQCFAMAIDAAGSAYVTGVAFPSLPTTAGAPQTAFGGGGTDAFVAKLNPAGSSLVYSTYLGGSNAEVGFGIAVDSAGSAHVAGFTDSIDFPTTPGALQPTGTTRDAFVTKLDPTGTALVYSTRLGGAGRDEARGGIAVDTAGNAYVAGHTESTDFPTTTGVFQPTIAGNFDIFVTKLDPTGVLVYSTYLGGSSNDVAQALAVDIEGNAYVTGYTTSIDFPTPPGAFQLAVAGGAFDSFVTKVNPTGSAIVYSSYLGGNFFEEGLGIAVDVSSPPNAYVVGGTNSTTFPTTAGAFQTTLRGSLDAFVVKIAPFNTPVGTDVSAEAGHGVTVTFTGVVAPGDTGATTSATGPTPPAGFTLGNPPTYYDLTTTATFVPPVSVCIAYDPAQFGDPSSLRLFHFESAAWVDVTTSNNTGTHVICGQVSSFSVFAIAQPGSSLTSLGPANIWVGLKNSDAVGIRFDLRAEVYRNGTQLVGSGELASVPGGSSGFNNAKQNTITLTPVAGAAFQSGDTVSIKLYVRNACSGSGKNAGEARLWFNDSAANSRFDATIGNPATYYLRDGFSLATTAGPGPKKTIDVAAGAKCSPYKTIGTWSTTLP